MWEHGFYSDPDIVREFLLGGPHHARRIIERQEADLFLLGDLRPAEDNPLTLRLFIHLYRARPEWDRSFLENEFASIPAPATITLSPDDDGTWACFKIDQSPDAWSRLLVPMYSVPPQIDAAIRILRAWWREQIADWERQQLERGETNAPLRRTRAKYGPRPETLEACESAMREWLDRGSSLRVAAELAGVDDQTVQKYLPVILKRVSPEVRQRWLVKLKELGKLTRDGRRTDDGD